MMGRCADQSNHLYGGRGIRVAEPWKSFRAFLADMGECPSPKHSIDRWPNTDGHYEPGNCRWATAKQQTRNTRRTVRVDYNGQRMALADACELSGLPYSTVIQRLRRLGWTPDRALSEPRRMVSRA